MYKDHARSQRSGIRRRPEEIEVRVSTAAGSVWEALFVYQRWMSFHPLPLRVLGVVLSATITGLRTAW
jgi:hypothetical protein